nr:MAG TPA: hypothetical protein [Caudoviricetes sp.]
MIRSGANRSFSCPRLRYDLLNFLLVLSFLVLKYTNKFNMSRGNIKFYEIFAYRIDISAVAC